MFLALVLKECEELVRADFQQYYGTNLSQMCDDPDHSRGEYSVYHAACLAYNLPRDSRVMRKLVPEYWSDTVSLLALCEFWAHSLCWMLSEDGRHGRNKPKLHRPVDQEEKTAALTREELDRILGKRSNANSN